jgi:hypothetical protein
MGIFCLPALYNRHPILYPDSVAYFHSGSAALETLTPVEAVMHEMVEGKAQANAPEDSQSHLLVEKTLEERSFDGTSTSRSPYYGATLVVLTGIGGEWALPLVQVLLSVIAIMIAARHVGRPRHGPLFAVCAASGLIAGLGIFSTTVMPDVFAGLAILAIAVLLAAFRDMSGRERAFWMALLLISCLFHKANLAASAVLTFLGIGYFWLTGRRDMAQTAALGGMIIAAMLGHTLVNVAVEKASGRAPVQTPFLLARLVGDGTAEQYLRKHCPRTSYALCQFLPRMPMTENDFLWNGVPPKTVMKTAPVETQEAITRESDAIIKGVLTEFPLQQALISTDNVLRQFFEVGVREYGVGVAWISKDVSGMQDVLRAYDGSRIAQHSMPLAAISIVILISYLAGFAGIGALAMGRDRRSIPRQSWEIATAIIVGVMINAAISGVIAGVFDRYQGRVAWLIPFVALLLWLQWRRATTNARRAR